MRVIRKKSILEEINNEIRDNTKPPIERIDLNNKEFAEFLHSLCGSSVGTTPEGELIRLKPEQGQFVTESNVRYTTHHTFTSFKLSYVVYKGILVQCYGEGYGEGGV